MDRSLRKRPRPQSQVALSNLAPPGRRLLGTKNIQHRLASRPEDRMRHKKCYPTAWAMLAVNPEILVWARETAGLSLEDAVRKIGIRDARGKAAVVRLKALECGEERPTRPTLVKMARCYRRPLLAFYLNAPPRRDDSCTDFRKLPGDGTPNTDPLVEALVSNLVSRQQMVRAALEAEAEAESLPFVGSLLRSEDTDTGIDSLYTVLESETEFEKLSHRAVNLLHKVLGEDLTAKSYYEEPSAEAAFQLLRSRTEDSGVFVLLKGDLGSHHSAIDVEGFRGSAIADDVAPFIVINTNDSRPAHSFTLLHELTHLLLGQSGFGNANAETRIERFCNNVAAQWLLPVRTLDEIGITRGMGGVEIQQRIVQFAHMRNLSRTMVAYRLLRTNHIDQPTFEQLRKEFHTNWQKHRDERRAPASQRSGGPDDYIVHRHRVGQGLLALTRRMLDSGALSTTKAARVLGVKPRQVGKALQSALAL